MIEQQNQWYTLHTKPKYEFKVAHTLAEVGLEVFLPEIHAHQNNQLVKTPFFPCYLFMAADLNQVKASAWQWVPGMRYIVAYGTEPICIPTDVIQFIKVNVQKLNNKQSLLAANVTAFMPGDTVRIIDGPLKEMIGIFEGPTRPSRRVHVLLQLVDHQRRVQLNAADIEKVSDMYQGSNRRKRRTRGRGRFITQQTG